MVRVYEIYYGGVVLFWKHGMIMQKMIYVPRQS